MIAELHPTPVAPAAAGKSAVDGSMVRLAEAVARAAPGDVTRDGAIYQRSVCDGMEICVFPRMFNAILTYGRADDQCGYITHWCYETPGQAVQAAEEWSAVDGEPEGWFRHSQTGRRRPNGDPEQEYVAL